MLLKQLVKKVIMGKSLPMLLRTMCNKPESKMSECTCPCCSGGSLSDFEPAAVQTPAPDFKGKAWHDGFKDVSLSDYKGKYVVLFFYPLDFTFVCPTEIIEFSKKAALFRETSKMQDPFTLCRLRSRWLLG